MKPWLAAVLLLLPLAAGAQETRLTLMETGMATRVQDVPMASLRVEARAATAAAAQQQVNRAMAVALEEARRTAGVLATTTGAYTQRVDDNKAWLAVQVLNLRGGEGAALAELVGSLQLRGLALNELGWQLSEDAQRALRDEATRQGLSALRARAGLVAAELGMSVSRIERVALDTSLDQPAPRMAAMAARAAAPAPPSNVPTEATVTTRISAEIILVPRQEAPRP